VVYAEAVRAGSSTEPHLIDRHDLVAALDDAAGRKVTIISAPAGSWKTSLRLTGDLAEIRAADLRFTEAETRALLASSGVVLSDDAVLMLYRRTEGWAAGLRLAAISLAGHPDPERFVAEFSGSNRTVAEYLVAEMLERQPDHVRNLLLRTSLPDRVNGELADLLAGRPGSEQILLDLEDANAFVVSLGPERTWSATTTCSAACSGWNYAGHCRPRSPSCTGGRPAGSATTATRPTPSAISRQPANGPTPPDHSFSMTLDGQAETIRALQRAFPAGAYADYAELALVYATDDLAEAEARLAIARSHARTTPPDRQRRLEIAIASLDLVLARQRGHFTDVIERVNRLAAHVTGGSNAEIALVRDLRAKALLTLGTAEAWSLRLPDSERHLRAGAALARDIGRPYLRAVLAVSSARCSTEQHRSSTISRPSKPISSTRSPRVNSVTRARRTRPWSARSVWPNRTG